ncbi:MAG TPA: sugar phosphate isomerase/epimerase family protein [Spirochaetia bacterium]
MKKTAVGTWAFIWGGYKEDPIPFRTAIEKMAALKYDGIELGAFPPHLEPNTKEKQKELKKILDDNHLAICGVAAPFPSPATSKPEAYLDVVKQHLDMCAVMGIPKLRVDAVDGPTAVPGGMDYETAFGKIAEVWNKTAELCSKQKVKLIWEFEPGFFLNKPSEVVRMTNAVAHPNFSILFDSCHGYMCGVVGARQTGKKEILPGGVVQFIYMLTGKIGHIHLIDSDGTLHDNDTSTHAPLGTGLLNFAEIIPALKAAGYEDEWWPADLCFWPKALDLVEETKNQLDGLIRKFG